MAVYVEVTDVALPSAGLELAPEDQIKRLEVAGEVAGAACMKLFENMGSVLKGASHPAEIAIEFGVSLGGEAGIPFVAKGTAQGTFKVSAKWKLDA